MEFSKEGLGEIQVPAGKFTFTVSIFEAGSSTGWVAKDFARIKNIIESKKLPTYEVADGAVVDIVVRMVRQEQQPQAVRGRPLTPDRRYIPISPPGKSNRERDAYENGVFVPNPEVRR